MSIIEKMKAAAFTVAVAAVKTPMHELSDAELAKKVKVRQVKNKEGKVVLSLTLGIFPLKGLIFGQDKTVVEPEEVEEASEQLLKLVATQEGAQAIGVVKVAMAAANVKRVAKLEENKKNPKPAVKKTRKKKVDLADLMSDEGEEEPSEE